MMLKLIWCQLSPLELQAGQDRVQRFGLDDLAN